MKGQPHITELESRLQEEGYPVERL
jgi:hypothetical protein